MPYNKINIKAYPNVKMSENHFTISRPSDFDDESWNKFKMLFMRFNNKYVQDNPWSPETGRTFNISNSSPLQNGNVVDAENEHWYTITQDTWFENEDGSRNEDIIKVYVVQPIKTLSFTAQDQVYFTNCDPVGIEYDNCFITKKDPEEGEEPIDYSNCFKGCPNYANQLVKYMEDVNAAATYLGVDKKYHLRYFVADGEDLGGYTNAQGWCELQHAFDDLKEELERDIQEDQKDDRLTPRIGYAKSLNSARIMDEDCYSDLVLPEAYWFMNENIPMGGTAYQMKYAPDYISKHICYRDFINKPAQLLKYFISTAATFNLDDGNEVRSDASNLNAMRTNIYNQGDNYIWPMFSIENISMEAEAAECLASSAVPCKNRTCCSGITLSRADLEKAIAINGGGFNMDTSPNPNGPTYWQQVKECFHDNEQEKFTNLAEYETFADLYADLEGTPEEKTSQITRLLSTIMTSNLEIQKLKEELNLHYVERLTVSHIGVGKVLITFYIFLHINMHQEM